MLLICARTGVGAAATSVTSVGTTLVPSIQLGVGRLARPSSVGARSTWEPRNEDDEPGAMPGPLKSIGTRKLCSYR
jgi:hypothetical protein